MNVLTQGMFLCAGLSTRMRPLTQDIPKVLLPLGEKKILAWMAQYFAHQNIQSLAVNLHHGAKHAHHFLEAFESPVDIHTFTEDSLLGTGGGIKNMQAFVHDDHFFVMNCDVMTEPILQAMFTQHLAQNALATLLLVPDPAQTYTPIYTDANQRIHSILSPDPSLHTKQGMFGGVSIFSKEIFKHVPTQRSFCMVRELLEPICHTEKICGFTQDIRWLDTGEIKLYKHAQEALAACPFDWMTASNTA